MELDVVCQMEVDPAYAIWREYHGKRYDSCAEGCSRVFMPHPEH